MAAFDSQYGGCGHYLEVRQGEGNGRVREKKDKVISLEGRRLWEMNKAIKGAKQ